ncbi:HD family hydrolase [Candidatus Omnitrophota bacterium]
MKSILNFILEAGMLKQVPRSGWSVLGIKRAESVAGHSFRCAVIGYLLARMEGEQSEEVLLMTLFNDLHEARIGDLHKMAQRYLNIQAAEDHSFAEQIDKLPKAIKQELKASRRKYRRQSSKAAIIARDADILECLIQAQEYYQQGFKQAAKFMRKAPGHLVTKSAKRLWRQAKTSDPNAWWVSLSEFKR